MLIESFTVHGEDDSKGSRYVYYLLFDPTKMYCYTILVMFNLGAWNTLSLVLQELAHLRESQFGKLLQRRVVMLSQMHPKIR